MGTRIIYEPKGRAREYAPLAANLWTAGCVHGCLYCFGPSMMRKDRQAFHDPSLVAPRKNVLELLARDARKLQGDPRPVLLSFVTDPYQEAEGLYRLTRQAIEILNGADLAATILTKGGLRAARDFDLLSQNSRNAFAVSLTCLNESSRLEWEPHASPADDRITTLRLAKEMGIQTWASFEPVICPDQSLRLMELAAPWLDFAKVGKLNYHPVAGIIDWRRFRVRAVDLLNSLNIPFLLKKDLETAA